MKNLHIISGILSCVCLSNCSSVYSMSQSVQVSKGYDLEAHIKSDIQMTGTEKSDRNEAVYKKDFPEAVMTQEERHQNVQELSDRINKFDKEVLQSFIKISKEVRDKCEQVNDSIALIDKKLMEECTNGGNINECALKILNLRKGKLIALFDICLSIQYTIGNLLINLSNCQYGIKKCLEQLSINSEKETQIGDLQQIGDRQYYEKLHKLDILEKEISYIVNTHNVISIYNDVYSLDKLYSLLDKLIVKEHNNN